MASKLDQMLQPDERVLFRTARDDRKTAGRVMLVMATIVGVLAMVSAVLSAWTEDGLDIATAVANLPGFALLFGALLLIPLVLMLPVIMATVNGLAAIATDMRVLFRPGGIGGQVVEIPLWHIAAVERTEGWLRLRDRTGQRIEFVNLPDPEGLGAAILAETGLPAPVQPVGRLKTWAEWVSGATFMFSVVAFFALSILMIVSSAVDGLVAALLPDDTWLWLRVGMFFVVLLAVTFLPSFAISAGGAVAATLAMRPFLSAAEAGQVFDIVIYHLRDYPRDHWYAKLLQWPFRTARRLAARIYGEPV